MIELRDDTLVFRFPQLHEQAGMEISFQRTLRLPDDGNDYPLPPGLGRFPLRHVDDFAGHLPATWQRHGGVMLPMYQAEAMWLSFECDYPCAVKIGAGKVNTVTGDGWSDPLCASPQDYLVTPEQPWLDGFVVERGEVRQFVAMPLGAGYTAEEQLTGKAAHGGLQIAVYPMRPDHYEALGASHYGVHGESTMMLCCEESPPSMELGLAPGGRMRQEIFADEHGLDAWQHDARARCFVHLADSLSWARITAEPLPTLPPTAADYTAAGLPWFQWYDDEHRALEALPPLAGLRGVGDLHRERTGQPLPGDAAAMPNRITPLARRGPVREPEDDERHRRQG